MLKEQKNYIKKFFTDNYKVLIALAVVYFASFSSIIRANYYYLDDMTRTVTGQKGWDFFSRYVSVWLSTLVHGDDYLSDVAPLTQIIAILMLSLSGVLAVKAISNRKVKAIDIVAVLPMGLVPYFLECISYRFDSPYMALSILASVFPCALYKEKNKMSDSIFYVLTTIVATLVVCMTYQAATGIFPMLVAIMCAKKWNDGENIRNIIKLAGLSIIGYLFAIVVFKYFIMSAIGTYVTTYQAPLDSLLSTIIGNIKQYFATIIRDFKLGWKLVISIIAVLFVVIFAIQSKRNKLLAIVVGLITVTIMSLMSFGVYSMLEKTIFNPRAMYGVGSLIAFLAIYICSYEKTSFKYVPRLACIALSWMFITFSFTYGNCLYSQAQYTDFRARLIISDLNDIEAFSDVEKTKFVNIHGDIGMSPVVQSINFESSTMLKSLIPETLSDSDGMRSRGFYYYYGLKNVINYNGAFDDTDMELPLIKDTMYHTIYGDGTYFVVELKQ